MFHVKHFQ